MSDTILKDAEMIETTKEENPYEIARRIKREEFESKMGIVITKNPDGSIPRTVGRSSSSHGPGLFSRIPRATMEEIRSKIKK